MSVVAPDLLDMTRLLLCAFLVLAAGSAAAADKPNLVAPYRYRPAPTTLDSVERGKAQLYKNQLDTQSRALEQDRARGQLPVRDNQLRLDTQNELLRMNGLLDR
jgi:hypothetical protein